MRLSTLALPALVAAAPTPGVWSGDAPDPTQVQITGVRTLDISSTMAHPFTSQTNNPPAHLRRHRLPPRHRRLRHLRRQDLHDPHLRLVRRLPGPRRRRNREPQKLPAQRRPALPRRLPIQHLLRGLPGLRRPRQGRDRHAEEHVLLLGPDAADQHRDDVHGAHEQGLFDQ